MSRSRLLRAVGPAILLAAGGAYALASLDWCGRWPEDPPRLLARESGDGALRAGAARVQLSPPYPVVRAGYGPPRPEARRSDSPLYARALVVEAGGVRFGIVSADLLLVPGDLARELRDSASRLGISELWVSATHAHSSFGGFDPALLPELAGTGRFRADVRAALLGGCSQALEKAAAALRPSRWEVGAGAAPELALSRQGGEEPDARLTRIRISSGAEQVAQLVVFGAHPTLHPRDDVLSPDYPGFLEAELEAEGGVAIFLPGAVGNTMPQAPDKASSTPGRFASLLLAHVRAIALAPEREHLGFARVLVPLPRPDSGRLVPRLAKRAGDNLLCASAPRAAELSLVELGNLRLLAIPGEITAPAATPLEQAAGARAVSGVGGYLGYVERGDLARAGLGESPRQYFGPGLDEALLRGARVAAGALSGK